LIFVDHAKSLRLRCGDKICHEVTLGRTVLKAGLCLLTGLLLVLWSAGMAGMAELARWLAAELPRWVNTLPPLPQWPQPVWLSMTFDPALVQAAQGFLVWLLDVLRLLGLSIQGLGTFLVVVIGVVWALGALALVAVALMAYLLWSRSQRRRSVPV
jgi:hypothetical protein